MYAHTHMLHTDSLSHRVKHPRTQAPSANKYTHTYKQKIIHRHTYTGIDMGTYTRTCTSCHVALFDFAGLWRLPQTSPEPQN